MSKEKKTYAVGGTSTQQQPADKSPLLKQKIVFVTVLLLIAAIAITATGIYANYVEPVLSEKTNTAETLETSSATIRNGGFDFVIPSSQNVLGYPHIATNWTLTRESNTKTIAGIISVKDDVWSSVSTQLSALGAAVDNPGQPDNSSKNDDEDTESVYMLNNISETYSSVKNYSSFSVASKSYNKITLWVKTIDVEQSDVYIWLKRTSASTSPELAFSDVVTNGEWVEYSFYVEGGESSSTSLYIEVGIGQNTTEGYDNAKGVVFIDDIVLNNTSKGEYLKMKGDSSNATSKTISFYDEEDRENIAQLNVANVFETITADQYIAENNDENGDPALFPFVMDELENTSVYKLVNDGTTKSKGGTLIQPFTVNSPSISDHYRLSFYVRTKDLRIDKGANIYLYVDGERQNSSYTTFFSSVRTPEKIADDTFNGWVQYTYYIKPSNIKDFTLQLEIWLGNMVSGENLIEPVTGTLYVTDIELNKITLSTYTSASANNYAKKVDLSSSTFTPSSSSTLTNGSFESLPGNVSASRYPYSVSSWYAAEQFEINTSSDDSTGYINDVEYGIISRYNAANASLGISDDTDFIFSNTDIINQLYIKNNKSGGTAFGMRSSRITLAANSFYHISVVAKEIDGGKAFVYLTGDLNMSMSNVTVTSNRFIPTNELDYSDNGFVQYHFYIATGEVAKVVYLELYNGEKIDENNENTVKTNGIVVFDLADYATMTEDEFNALSEPDKNDDSYEQPFESYDSDEASISLTPLFENVAGLDLSNETAVVRPADPVDEVDDETEEAEPINWITILVSIATLLMVVAVIVAIVVITRRKRLAAAKAKELEEQQPSAKRK